MSELVAETATPTVEHEVRRLNKADRCDKCGSEAFVLAILPGGGELTFCGHHGREYDTALREQAVIVKSYIDEINSTPSPSANAE